MKDRTFEAIERQVDAMGAEVFEVGLFKPGATPEMMPRTWDKAMLVRSVGWLKYQNSQGRNIYIRPKGEHSLSLIDDLTRESVDRMKREGFEPCVVVETSPGNFQAWINHGRVLPKAESTAAARALADRFGGDKGAADWRHFGRIAGLTNRKSKRQGSDGQFPFVRLLEGAPGLVYSAATAFLNDVRGALKRVRPVPAALQTGTNCCQLTISDFRARPEYDGDGNRIDLAYAVYALAHGVSETSIQASIASRDLAKKGDERRQNAYIDRTVRKAIAALDGTLLATRSRRHER